MSIGGRTTVTPAEGELSVQGTDNNERRMTRETSKPSDSTDSGTFQLPSLTEYIRLHEENQGTVWIAVGGGIQVRSCKSLRGFSFGTTTHDSTVAGA
jgi:hypothetical protein